MKHKTKILN